MGGRMAIASSRIDCPPPINWLAPAPGGPHHRPAREGRGI